MVDSSDMSTPVTRGELRAEIVRIEIRLDQMATKADLESWGATLLARIDLREQRVLVLAELARHAKAIQEAMSTQISAIDEKYADLPAGVPRHR
jgi:hypothetical protein